MYECYCSRGLYYICIMCFQLATTTYEHYYQREPVNFFYYVHLSTYDHVCMLLAKCCSLYFFIMCFQLATIMYECITLVVRSLFLLCFQLATTMYECYCSRGPYYIFIMCFQLARTMYEHSCPRCPVYFFLIMCCYLGKTMYEHYCPIGGV